MSGMRYCCTKGRDGPFVIQWGRIYLPPPVHRWEWKGLDISLCGMWEKGE